MVEYFPAVTRAQEPRVSVCIAHYKDPKLIAACIDSVLAQESDFGVEIIVHDDASSDDSVAFIRKHYPQIEILASQVNVGFCVANNRMVAQARGQFVLLLNNDAALLPGALATLADAAAQQNPTGILTLPQYDWESGELVDRGCLLDLFYNPVPNKDPYRNDVAMVIGACLWIERKTWTQLGGFPEWFESIGEDLYLCCAARLAGLPVQALSESGYRHRQGSSFGGGKLTDGKLASSFRRRQLSERNKTYVLFVMTPTVFVWPMLWIHIIILVSEGVALSVVGLNYRPLREIYLNTVLSLWRERGFLMARRRTIRKTISQRPFEYYRRFVVWPRKLTMLKDYGWPSIRG